MKKSEVSFNMKHFINFSNHPSKNWGADQIQAAEMYGMITDMPFPSIDPLWTADEVHDLAKKYAEKIRSMQPAYVLCQGEFTFVFSLITVLKQYGIKVGAACSARRAMENVKADGTVEKTAVFKFIQFREY